MKHRLLFAGILWIIHSVAFAQLRLPNVLSDHMVLQRNATAHIWGWGYPASKVQVKAGWLSDTLTTQTDAGGRWLVELKTADAGGPYEISVSSGDAAIQLDDILLGDVWLCSGQSNMEWGGNQRLPEILEELPKANDPKIRLLNVSRTAADHPQYDIPNVWQTLDAGSLKPFSAIGYFVGKRLREELDVPIGIINASWGGTPAEVWTPAYLVENDLKLSDAASKLQPNPHWPHQPGVLWNSMIHPLTPFAISGFYWYQGESNVGTWWGYDKLMRTLISSWRNAWDADLPFYFVQIAPYTYNNQVPLAALLREQQARTATNMPHTGMVVITDLVDNIKDIHPSRKREVADRLANLALHEHYGKVSGKDYRSPVFRHAEINGNTVLISFDYVEHGLTIKGDEVTDLFIAGADRVFHPAQGKIKGNSLEVSSPGVTHPLAVRFGFTETAMPNLFSTDGLPVSPFRTDDWPIE